MRLTAIAGKRIKSLPVTPTKSEWMELLDNDGFPYRQATLTLHTRDDRVWGYLQLGRSLEEVRKYKIPRNYSGGQRKNRKLTRKKLD